VATSKKTEREAREARERLRRYTARQEIHTGQQKRRRRDNLFAIGAVLVVAALATVTQVFYFSAGPGMPTAEPSASAEPTVPPGANVGDVPDPSVAEARTWTGTLQLNGLDFGIELDGAAAPQAVASFVTSTDDGYYQDKTCHRLVLTETAGLIQCGSFDGVGGTDTGYSFGPLENTAPDGATYPAGTIAMARAADNAYSQGRQFFITFGDSTLPDDSVGGYTIIGHVTSGLDQLLLDIAGGGITDTGRGSQDGAPTIPTVITGLSIQ
jgi:peptidyl-prolyl cis-trans isomerase B (cyclophilin B)